MNTKQFRRQLRKDPHLRQWVKANQNLFRQHPQILGTMLNNPSFLEGFRQSLSKNQSRLQRRVNRLQSRQFSNQTAKRKLNLKMPPLSELNEKLSHATDFIHTLQSLMGSVKK